MALSNLFSQATDASSYYYSTETPWCSAVRSGNPASPQDFGAINFYQDTAVHTTGRRSTMSAPIPRRRVQVACNVCRHRKIKCSGDAGDDSRCGSCDKSNQDSCNFFRVGSSKLEYADTKAAPRTTSCIDNHSSMSSSRGTSFRQLPRYIRPSSNFARNVRGSGSTHRRLTSNSLQGYGSLPYTTSTSAAYESANMPPHQTWLDGCAGEMNSIILPKAPEGQRTGVERTNSHAECAILDPYNFAETESGLHGLSDQYQKPNDWNSLDHVQSAFRGPCPSLGHENIWPRASQAPDNAVSSALMPMPLKSPLLPMDLGSSYAQQMHYNAPVAACNVQEPVHQYANIGQTHPFMVESPGVTTRPSSHLLYDSTLAFMPRHDFSSTSFDDVGCQYSLSGSPEMRRSASTSPAEHHVLHAPVRLQQ